MRALKRPAAGKTGTTNDFHDAWFIGYTPEIVAGVWVGFDNQVSLGKRETGGRVAAPVWLAFMQEALRGQPVTDFPIPPGIRFVRQDVREETGAIARTPGGRPVFRGVYRPGLRCVNRFLGQRSGDGRSPAGRSFDARRRDRSVIPPDAQSTGPPASGY